MKVVKSKKTGEILYRSEPEFEKGMGIKNASIIKGVSKDELEEVEIEDQEWDERIQPSEEEVREQKIQAEMRKIAEDSLVAKGELVPK